MAGKLSFFITVCVRFYFELRPSGEILIAKVLKSPQASDLTDIKNSNRTTDCRYLARVATPSVRDNNYHLTTRIVKLPDSIKPTPTSDAHHFAQSQRYSFGRQ